MKQCTPTNFPSPQENAYLTVIENKFIIWNYSFSDPTNIYLLKFSNNNRRIKCESSSELTIEGPDFVLVSLLLTLNIFDLFLLGIFCWVWTCKCHGMLNCFHLNSSMCFRFGSRGPVTLKTKLSLTTVSSYYLFFITKSSILDVAKF